MVELLLMTISRATPDQWAFQEHWATEDSDAACLLELRARVETLEAQTFQSRCDHLRLANTCASMAPNRSKFFADLMPDQEQDDLNKYPSSTHQVKRSSSLTKRVATAISCTPDGSKAEAQAAISAVIDFLREDDFIHVIHHLQRNL
jgi:hypothetical protein